MQKVTPFLWFDGNAEAAVEFYTSVLKPSEVLATTRYGDSGPGPKGSVMTIKFSLQGQEFVALNGGPQFSFTPAVSFAISCDDQSEIDRLWRTLSDGGETSQCGWLTDQFGLSWQIVPSMLEEWVDADDPKRAERVMRALMGMTKLDIRELETAARGSEPERPRRKRARQALRPKGSKSRGRGSRTPGARRAKAAA